MRRGDGLDQADPAAPPTVSVPSTDPIQAVRRRARRRTGAVMALIVGPIVLVGTVLRAVEVHRYPPGDFRNEPAFWIAMVVLAFVVLGGMIAGSIRLLRGPEG